ncbi:hypothetical protein DVH05_021507 [Phytophthora capsici]|nr:hypothetical protein DVH05_021507 [Phytophthora capsici]
MASGKSVDDVFVLLKLDQEGEKLLANPLFTTFTKVTNTLNQQKPDNQQTAAISVLTTHYGDEVIAKMLGRVPMSKFSTDLETALLQKWVSGKMKPRLATYFGFLASNTNSRSISASNLLPNSRVFGFFLAPSTSFTISLLV